MMMNKMRVVHYLNQFFGQIGGEAQANVGFTVKEGPVGPGMLLQKELGDMAEIVATIICGDDFFAVGPEKNAEIGLEKLMPFKPDIFFAGPAFAAGRYTIACGAMCKKVAEKLQIPAISAMNMEAPGVDIYRKDAFIIKTGIHSKEMSSAVKDMARLAIRLKSGGEEKLLTFEDMPDPEEYKYFSRNMLRNIICEETVAERSVSKLLKKIKGEPFTSEVIPPVFEIFEIPAAIKNLSKAKIAFVTDGGLVPKGNPDGMATRSNLRWGAYDIEKIFNDYEVVHAGYFNDYVLESPYRLVPLDALSELVGEGKVGGINNKLYSMPACTTVSRRCAEVGTEMAEAMQAIGDIDGVILTST
jgi:glycine reductase